MEDLELSAELGMDHGRRVDVDDFDLLKVLGRGSFAKVMLVRYKGDSRLYALKIMSKSELLRRKQLTHTATERRVLEMSSHPYVISLKFAWQTPDKLFLVTNYCAGGELFGWLKKKKIFPEAQVRVWGAEMASALCYLHSRDIVYRDLKPENILLDDEGHIQIADFGLSKQDVAASAPGEAGAATTFCGTPEYLAPEVLLNKGHGKAVDWWALGTLLYELLTGLPPFYNENVEIMYRQIMNAELTFPPHVSIEAQDLLARLLIRDPRARLGSGPSGLEDVRAHPFFGPIDWEQLERREIPVPFVPPTARDAGLGNFDAEFTGEAAIVESMRDAPMSETAVDRANFEGFTYNEGSALK
jgi:serum/glucocorticoid-regulated kinase 2